MSSLPARHGPAPIPDASRASPTPMPLLGKIGFGVTLVVCGVLPIPLILVMFAWSRHVSSMVVWLALYAGLLAWGWFRLRPRPGRERAFKLVAGPLALQACLYAVFVGLMIVDLVGDYRLQPDSFLSLCLFFLLVVGPLCSGLALVVARGAAVLFAAELLGATLIGLQLLANR